jgi:hypothetical protein
MSHTQETSLVVLIQLYTCEIIGLVTPLYCELKSCCATLTPGSSVIKHLKQDQYLEVYRSKRKQLKESKQIRSMTRQRKYEMHAAICYKLPVHYRNGIADPKSS